MTTGNVYRRSTVFLLCLVLLAFLAHHVGLAQSRKRPAKTTAAKRTTASPTTTPAQQAARLNNLGVAYMGQQKMELALGQFQQARKLAPELFAAQLNTGIALLNLQRLEPAK